MNKQISTGAGIAAMVVAAVIIAGAAWLAMTPKTQAPTETAPAKMSSMQGQVQNQTPAQNATQAASLENMNTYKNDQWGIQFNYPKTWKIDKERSTSGEVVFNPPGSEGTESREALAFQKNTKNLSLEKMAAEMIIADPSSIYKKENLTVAGEKAIKEYSGEFSSNFIVFLHKNNAYMITTQNGFTDQIISTIKFTK
jgi:hypothetical protein